MRALKALVIFLGILILIGAGIVGITIYKRASGKIEVALESAPAAKQTFGNRTVALPQGAHLDDVAAADGRLILRLRLADGTPRLLILDLETGAELGRLDFAPAP